MVFLIVRGVGVGIEDIVFNGIGMGLGSGYICFNVFLRSRKVDCVVGVWCKLRMEE